MALVINNEGKNTHCTWGLLFYPRHGTQLELTYSKSGMETPETTETRTRGH